MEVHELQICLVAKLTTTRKSRVARQRQRVMGEVKVKKVRGKNASRSEEGGKVEKQ